MKKKFSILIVLAMTAAVPFMSGCGCDDIKQAKNDILQMRALVLNSIANSTAWVDSCTQLGGLAAALPSHKAKVDKWKDSECDSDNSSSNCKSGRALSSALRQLKDKTEFACTMANSYARPGEPVSGMLKDQLETAGRQILVLINQKIIPPGTVILRDKCEDSDLFSELGAAGLGDRRSSELNSSGRPDETTSEQRRNFDALRDAGIAI